MSDADAVLKLLVLQELLKQSRSDDSSSSAKCTSLLEAGLKVVRGPDWKWGNQDGGEGHVGTVVQVGSSNGSLDKQVIVVWDNGVRGNYRIGYSNAYDLRTLDNSSIGVNHPSVYCSTCHTNKMKGMRWTCKICYDYDLCTRCYMGDRHDITHPFIRFQTNYGNQVDVPKREGSVKIPVRGIVSSAKVVRGDDWRWEGQDGGPGNSGVVIDVRGWDDDTDWTACNVIWSHNSSSNKYRIGYEGKVDLKCIEDAPDGYYYRDHLPITGDEKRAIQEPASGNTQVKQVYERGNGSLNRAENATDIIKESVNSTVMSYGESSQWCNRKRSEDKYYRQRVYAREYICYSYGGYAMRKNIGGSPLLNQNLKDLFFSDHFSDVTLKVQERSFQVHKAILCARSSVFASKLLGDNKGASTLIIRDYDADTFEDALFYMYTGKLKRLSHSNVNALCEVADKFEIKDLKEECARFKRQGLPTDYVSDFLAVA